MQATHMRITRVRPRGDELGVGDPLAAGALVPLVDTYGDYNLRIICILYSWIQIHSGIQWICGKMQNGKWLEI